MQSEFYLPGINDSSALVQSCWEVGCDERIPKESILPKGVIEIIFDFTATTGNPAMVNGKSFSTSRCFINGFNTGMIEKSVQDQQHLFGVQLNATAVKKFLHVPAGKFLNSIVSLDLLENSWMNCWSRLAEADSFTSRTGILISWLKTKAVQTSSRDIFFDAYLSAAHFHLYSVTSLASALCYSPRQLTRKCLEYTGMNAEDLLLYKKYLNAVRLLHHSDSSLTSIAYEAGFNDQSHFIRAFRLYTGTTPGDYRKAMSHVPGHLYGWRI